MNKVPDRNTSSGRHSGERKKATPSDRAIRTSAERNNDEFLRLAMEFAQLAFWEWSLETHRLIWGVGLERVFGVDERYFTGTYQALLELVHSDDRVAVQQQIALCLVRGDPCRIEFRNVRPNDAIGLLVCEGRPLRNKAGTVTRVIGIVQKVSEAQAGNPTNMRP